MQLQPQFPKHLSDRLPIASNRRFALYAATLSLGILLYGCGESKISQCNKVVTIANKTNALVAPKDITGFRTFAENIDQIRTEVQAIAVQDSKLKELQTQLLGVYGDASQALKGQVKATEAKDANAMTKAKQDLETASTKEGEVVDQINALCSK
jgi:predicted  nucleic acid-binding Zn-ribbon protein